MSTSTSDYRLNIMVHSYMNHKAYHKFINILIPIVLRVQYCYVL